MAESKHDNNKEKVNIPQSNNPLWLEILLSFSLCLFVALIGPLMSGLKMIPTSTNDILEFTYSQNQIFSFSKSLIYTALIAGVTDIIILTFLLLLIKPSGIKPSIGEKGRWLIPYILLAFFGELAYLVITMLASITKLTNEVSIGAAGFLTNIYIVLIYKLYLEKRTFSNSLFWEIFRFAIVGLVAAIFDFTVGYLIQFVAFSGNTSGYVTPLSTAGGFIIGVIINYLMSTYMVYKASSTNFSKTFKGIAFFVILSTVGMLLGIGIQYLCYDFFNLKLGLTGFSYPLVFIIRTLIVMVYNYITRKLFIFK
jgi:putative flippase GtrA